MILSVQGLYFVPEIPKQEGLVPAPESDNVKDVNKGQGGIARGWGHHPGCLDSCVVYTPHHWKDLSNIPIPGSTPSMKPSQRGMRECCVTNRALFRSAAQASF